MAEGSNDEVFAVPPEVLAVLDALELARVRCFGRAGFRAQRPGALGARLQATHHADALFYVHEHFYPQLAKDEKCVEFDPLLIVMVTDGMSYNVESANLSPQQQLLLGRPGNRVVFSCRSLDYSSSLSTSELRVPQVRIEPLTDDQVRNFLKVYSPGQ